ncbi:MAG: xylulokinase [TACK group archaeon]|nr:xylulokinase [TACK group archaeon]
MKGAPLYLGVDVGTSSVKALLVSSDGQVVGRASSGYGLIIPRIGWTEQRPEDWWQAVRQAIRQLLAAGFDPSDVEGIGLTGQMHDLVLLDSGGDVVRPAILWNDQRTEEQVAEIRRKVDLSKFIRVTGSAPQTGFTAPKLLWVKENEAENFEKARSFLLPKDYVGLRMTGQKATDVNDASGTSLFDVERRDWSEGLFSELGLPMDMAPPVLESQEVRGELVSDVSAELGLRRGIPVAAGAGDAGAGALAAGAVGGGLASLMVGTAGQVVVGTDQYRYDAKGRLHTWCQPVPGRWHVMGAILSAGGSLRWLRDALGAEEKVVAELSGSDAYDLLAMEASLAQPGSDGLIFLPYLSGERSPHGDPSARGVFFGLSLSHGKRQMARAVMEGVAYAFMDSAQAIGELGIQITAYRMVGGGARSGLWRSIMADVLGAPVELPLVDEGSSYGASLLSMVASGAEKDVGRLAARVVRARETVTPDPERSALYSRGYGVYKQLYPALKDLFKELRKVS